MTDAPTNATPNPEGDGAAAPSVRDMIANSAAAAESEAGSQVQAEAPVAKADPVRDAANAPDPGPDWAQGIPDHMRADTPEATLAKVAAGYQGLRTKLAEGAKGEDVPEKSDGYEWTLPDAYVEAAGGDVGDDPLISKFGDMMHEAGIGQAQANRIIGGVLETALEHGLVEAPMSLDDYFKELGGEETGQRLSGDVAAWGQNLMAQGAFGPVGTEAEKAEAQKHLENIFDMAADNPAYLRTLDQIRRAQGGPAMTLPTAEGDLTALTAENLRKEQADPRYDSANSQFDPNYRARVDARFAALDAKKAG